MPEGMRGREFLRHLALPDVDRYLDAIDAVPRDEHRASCSRPRPSALIGGTDPWAAERARLSTGAATGCRRSSTRSPGLPAARHPDQGRSDDAWRTRSRRGVPLLDHRLVEFAATIPPELRLRDGDPSTCSSGRCAGILPEPSISTAQAGIRRAAGALVPRQLAVRPRSPAVRDQPRPRHLRSAREIRRLVTQPERGRRLDLQLWTLISFELWCRRFLDGPGASSAGSLRGARRAA